MATKMINKEYCSYLDDYKQDFIVDTEADIATLPECCTGSKALVAQTGVNYIVNASGAWCACGSSGGAAALPSAEGGSF